MLAHRWIDHPAESDTTRGGENRRQRASDTSALRAIVVSASRTENQFNRKRKCHTARNGRGPVHASTNHPIPALRTPAQNIDLSPSAVPRLPSATSAETCRPHSRNSTQRCRSDGHSRSATSATGIDLAAALEPREQFAPAARILPGSNQAQTAARPTPIPIPAAFGVASAIAPLVGTSAPGSGIARWYHGFEGSQATPTAEIGILK